MYESVFNEAFNTKWISSVESGGKILWAYIVLYFPEFLLFLPSRRCLIPEYVKHQHIGSCNDCSTANIARSLNKKSMIVIIGIIFLTITAALLFVLTTNIVLLLIMLVGTISTVAQLLLRQLATWIVVALIILETMIFLLDTMIVFVATMPSPSF